MSYYACGDGWLPLIREAEAIVDKWNDEHPDAVLNFMSYCTDEKLELVDVKEKWGLLRLSCNFYPDDIYSKMRLLENRSKDICEYCGSTENVTTQRIRGWYKTLCPKCAEGDRNKF